jgi:hypothetical protein
MRVKIGENWYDSSSGPIMLELTDEDKKNIAKMNSDATKYCEYNPKISDMQDVHIFMGEPLDDYWAYGEGHKKGYISSL